MPRIEKLMSGDRIYKNAIDLDFETFYADPAYNAERRRRAILFSEFLGKRAEFRAFSREKKIAWLKDLELGCLDEAIRIAADNSIRCVWGNRLFCAIYGDICFNITSCLDPDSSVASTELMDNMLAGDVVLRDVASLSREELCPERYDDETRELFYKHDDKVDIKYSRFHTCGKCKKKMCTVKQVQTRSLDEGATTVITCHNCGPL